MVTKLFEVMSKDELEVLLKNTSSKHHRMAFLMGFYECMRISEIVNLRQEDVDYGMRLIRIKNSKGAKDRNIPIALDMAKVLKDVPIKCGIRALEIAFKNSLKRAGIVKDLHFHSLRHSGATYYLNVRKWDSRQIQQFLGHASLATTQIYTHVTPEDLINKMYEGR